MFFNGHKRIQSNGRKRRIIKGIPPQERQPCPVANQLFKIRQANLRLRPHRHRQPRHFYYQRILPKNHSVTISVSKASNMAKTKNIGT